MHGGVQHLLKQHSIPDPSVPPPSLPALPTAHLVGLLALVIVVLFAALLERRGKLAHLHVAAKRKLMEEKAIEHHEGQPTPEEEPIPVSQWLETYGADPYYPSRRIRRITEKAYYKVNRVG